MPSEDSLVHEFSASRNAVREALDMLRQDGLVSRFRSIGTTVNVSVLAHRIDSLQTLREIHGVDRVAITLLEASLVPASPYVAAHLDIDIEDSTVLIERLTLVEGEPVALRTSYFPPTMATHLLPQPPSGDLCHFLEHRLGVTLGRSDTAVEAQLVDPLTAELLHLSTGLPVLFKETLLRSADGEPLELSHTRYRGDRVSLTGSIERPVAQARRPRLDHSCPQCRPVLPGSPERSAS